VRGLWNLTWLEIKIFVREPLGLAGTVGVPVLLFVMLGRMFRGQIASNAQVRTLVGADVPILAVMLIALGAVLSLVTIVAIYRESGILKRLRATPLRPHTILAAHVLVKLIFSGLTLALMAAAGRRFYPVGLAVPWAGVAVALFVTTVSILSMGFLIASVVPTARFAQPIGTIVLYPMLAVSGLFVPVSALPPALQVATRVMPLTYAVSLLRGIWLGDAWSAHLGDLAALAVVFGVCTALSARVFRWE
jgi:ABC-2 type transport system permease protein